MRPQVSIIVPAFNAAPFIDACLGAILPQLTERHQLIVVDDGSRDATPAMLERWRAAHGKDNFQIITQPNGGISAARNAGLAAATGDYVAFVDSDDVLRDGALAKLAEAIATYDADAIAFDFFMWRPDRPSKSGVIALSYPPHVVQTDHDTILSDYFTDRHTYVWAYVIRRSVYGTMPAPVFPINRAFEDVSMLARLLHNCTTLVRIPYAIIDYRQHPSSITKAVSPKWCHDFTSALLQVAEYFRGQAVGDRLKLHIDVAAAYFYMGVVKNSYQLSWSEGRATREQVRSIFLEGLFHPPAEVLAALREGSLQSHNRRRDREIAGQLDRSLGGSLLFDVGQTVGRRIKRWRR